MGKQRDLHEARVELKPGRVYLSRAEGSGVLQFYGYDFIFLVIRTYMERKNWPMRADILMLSGYSKDKSFDEGFHTMTEGWWLWRNAKRLE